MGQEQLLEQAGVVDQPSHHGGPGPVSIPPAEGSPACSLLVKRRVFLPSPSPQPQHLCPEPSPWQCCVKGLPAPSARVSLDSHGLVLPGAAGTPDLLGCPQANPAGSCWISSDAHGLILPGGTGMPDLLGCSRAILEGFNPEPCAQCCLQPATAQGSWGHGSRPIVPPALADPGLPRGHRPGPARQTLGGFGRGSRAAVPAPRVVEGRPGRAFPFPA